MSSTIRKKRIGRNILIGLGIFLILAGIGFHLFVTRYLPPMVKKRLSEIIVQGSDSLYKFEMGNFDLSFWGGSASFSDLHITIDSNVYNRMAAAKKLPSLTTELHMPHGRLSGIGIRAILFSKKLNIRDIHFDSADVHLSRHFRTSNDQETNEKGQPLWKALQPSLKQINIGNIYLEGARLSYRNVDSASAFRWQIEKSDVLISDIRVDSTATYDTSRMLFAKNISFNSDNIKLKTIDGLYQLQAGRVEYASAQHSMQIKDFSFIPTLNDRDFVKQFGYQHELYKLKIPAIRLENFKVAQWVTYNKFQADVVELTSPNVTVHMDRNAKPNPYSKIGKYPHQILKKADFTINVGRVKAGDATVTYTETSNITGMTGKLVFSSLQGTIDNITNDPKQVAKNSFCVATIKGNVLERGSLQTVFRFNLASNDGAFGVTATIANLNAAQLQPLFKSMSAVDMQSFNMQRLDYAVQGNESGATGNLSLRYTDMDILINKVNPDGTFDKKGLLSFLANRLVIYKENPSDGEERKAANIHVSRDANKSFFNLIWKSMFTSAGDIVLRPFAQKRMEKKKERAERKEERQQKREERRAAREKK